MRAKEFLKESDNKSVTINIPITITIPSGNGDPVVATSEPEKPLPSEPVNVFPLQQELELLKHKSGKRSKVLSQILDDNGAFSEEDKTEKNDYDVKESLDELNAEFRRTMRENRSI